MAKPGCLSIRCNGVYSLAALHALQQNSCFHDGSNHSPCVITPQMPHGRTAPWRQSQRAMGMRTRLMSSITAVRVVSYGGRGGLVSDPTHPLRHA